MVREGNSKVVQERGAGWRGVVGGEFEYPCLYKDILQRLVLRLRTITNDNSIHVKSS